MPAPDVPYLPHINGMAPLRREFFDRESWTTTHIGHLAVGTVFALPRQQRGEPVRPVVLAEAPRREVGPGDYEPRLMNKESAGRLIGYAVYVDTGEAVPFDVLARTPVLTRCDLRYVPAGGGRRG